MPHVLAVDWVAISAVATASAALGTLVVVVIALFQRRDARLAAEAALRAATAAERSVEVQIAAQAEHSRIGTYPSISCKYLVDDEGAWIQIKNHGSFPAIDVDITALAIVYDSTPGELARDWALAEYASQVSQTATTDEGAFAIRDHLVYESIPPRTCVNAPLSFPDDPLPGYITAMVQYRDILGRNYLQHVDGGMVGPESRYSTISEYINNRITEAPRIDVFTGLIPTGLPDDFHRNFLEIHEHSVPTGWLRTPNLLVEDRGDWSVLQ